MKCIDPAAMAAKDRLAEIADLLARGVQRFLRRGIKLSNIEQNSQVRLAALGLGEAPCGSGALSPQSRKPA